MLEPYVGQWFVAQGLVDDVQGRTDDPVVYVYIRERNHRVVANFKKDKVRASSLRKGIAVRISGSFHHVQGYIESIYLEDCTFSELDRAVLPQPAPGIQEPPTNPELPASREKPVEIVASSDAPEGDLVREFSGIGVGKTDTFRVTRRFGFRWTPGSGVVIGSLHGTLNGIPHSWTFDNNLNPYFPARFSTPPDVPGEYYFSIDNIKGDTPWTITILNETPAIA